MDVQQSDLYARGMEMHRHASGLLVTLALGDIVFTSAFANTFAPKGAELSNKGLILTSWLALFVSVIAGFFVLYRLGRILIWASNVDNHEEGELAKIIASQEQRLRGAIFIQYISMTTGLVFLGAFIYFNVLGKP